ncbi:uncharacterized protein LOC120090998 [Benincasa hispida]|uniref:uncharacterized protein LOC120090529 n=1 Tax=Benincasa hispida TaxID=102211 RepID=UPI00190241F7|nr:uncharacterized protein LOC120090529 [Benincasa hispida]XP_038904179.1 uncharacterized protein LOC120090529 [Benincasa hispida]XP_038904180.1 uncharacterized protein LOC120090529 [Benincasa hispida]XP_038904181.1 uncharacterized protein LOC120090529 [Benincasa hispida]XP_038904692.1 uncharacterized protein LOC120090998 [Benincasa hispida]
MGSSLELRKSSSHGHNSRAGKVGALLPQPKRCPCPTVPEQFKMKSSVRPRSDLYCISTKGTNIAREKSSRYWQGKRVEGSPIGEDELVRYMSNLPGYLLRPERGENLQEKALSVGVLDWTRLENWKHKQVRCPTKGKDGALCIGNHLSLKQTTGLSTFPRVNQSETSDKAHSSRQSGLISSHKEKGAHCDTSVRNANQSQDFESGSMSAMKVRQKIQRNCASSSSGGNVSNMMQERERTKHSDRTLSLEMVDSNCTSSSTGGNVSNMMPERERTKRSDRRFNLEMVDSSSHVRHSGTLPCPKGSARILGCKMNHRTEKPGEINIQKKEADERMVLGKGEIPPKLSYDISLGLNDHMKVENYETKKRGGIKCSDINLPYNYFTYKQDTKFLLKQKPDDLEDGFHTLNTRASFDENMTDVNSCSYSEIFSPEDILSSECGSDIPFSSPLPSLADIDPLMGRTQDSLVCDTSAEISCTSFQLSPFSNQKPSLRPSGGKQIEKRDLDIKLTHSDLVDTLETLDDKTPDPGARKGRHPSPIRRLSFSLGRMGRSFSFKESSTLPQLNSTYTCPKSGPVISESSGCSDNSDRKKVNGHNRTRSSPLRRWIEPILKHKSSNPQHPIEGNVNSLGLWPTSLGGAHEKKHDESPMQALLQFTIKNGFPLFKLLVDNNRNVLAATARDLTPSGKNGSGQSYTFYLVNEIKRKTSGWIRPGNRDRSYGYAYNVIGQMKVNSDYKTNEHSNGKYTLRELILFGVEMRPGDRESAIMVKHRELAAIVLKIPTENKHDGQWNGNVLIENYMESLSEDNAVVILPGAAHGSPSSGEPSPLINRWRSGGVCDCGGWDEGCKLRILSIPKKRITSKACPISKCLELFVQGDEQDKPVFSMVPLKGGFFEVRFDSSISMLQAFFICVAVLNGQNPADPSEASKFAPEGTMIKDPDSNGINIVREKQPASIRYAPNPPLSPVGRV